MRCLAGGQPERRAEMMACVLRDAEHHALTRETSTKQFGPYIAAWHEVLGAKLGVKQRAMLHLALSFHTWRTLGETGLTPAATVTAMVHAIENADAG